jgi:hypothetical protein
VKDEMKPLAFNSRKLLVLGTALGLVGILLAVSFHFTDNHRWYWSTAPAALCVVSILCAAWGGFLLGRGASQRGERHLALAVFGGLLGLVCLVSGTAAFSLVFLAKNYFAGDDWVGWDTYAGDYLVGWFHIRLLQLSVLAGLVGGFSGGLGLPSKR